MISEDKKMLENLEGKRLLILGGIRPMLEVVNQAKQMGVIVYVTDYNENSPCKAVADKSFMVNATDADAVVELCKQEQIDGVLTGYVDMLLPYYAEICEKAGLPCYATKEQFETITNKKSFKDLCIKHHVPVAREYSIADVNNEKIPFPVVVKPTDGSGSRGVAVCSNAEELMEAIDQALLFSKEKSYIIEDYLNKGKVLMHYYFQDGKPVFVGAADQYMVQVYEDKSPVAACLLYPSRHIPQFVKQEDQNIRNMLMDLGIQNGTIELETYLYNDSLCVGDIGFRLCGSRVQYTYKEAYGLFSPELLINFALTGKMANYDICDKIDLNMHGRYYGKINIAIRPGKIEKVVGIEELADMPAVSKNVLIMHEGEELKEEERGKLRQIVSRIFFSVDSIDEYAKTAQKIYDTIDFLDCNGNSLKLSIDVYDECVTRYMNCQSNMISGGTVN